MFTQKLFYWGGVIFGCWEQSLDLPVRHRNWNICQNSFSRKLCSSIFDGGNMCVCSISQTWLQFLFYLCGSKVKSVCVCVCVFIPLCVDWEKDPLRHWPYFFLAEFLSWCPEHKKLQMRHFPSRNSKLYVFCYSHVGCVFLNQFLDVCKMCYLEGSN